MSSGIPPLTHCGQYWVLLGSLLLPGTGYWAATGYWWLDVLY